ncbi:MAG TPA: DNA-processing protein DprA [Gammaproteobacteria bacterium]
MTHDAWLAVLYAARSPENWLDLVAAAPSADAVLALSDRALADAGIDAEAIARLRCPDPGTLDGWRGWLEQPGHALVTLGSPRYPRRLAEIPQRPLALWIRGARPELLDAPQLAIVGSRSPTRGGCLTAEELARYLSERGLTITSGLASGIDGAGHEGALHGPGGTIAVFGCGIDTIFPRGHRDLAERIAASGLLVSEYPPGVPPAAHRFPRRNRIIAALSLGTLVVEASRRSGSLITARFALDFGREVFAVPGSIHNPLARGCHWLLRQGAKLVEEGKDVLVELAPQLELEWPETSEETPNEAPPVIDPEYANLMNCLGFDPVTITDLAARSGLTTAELSSMLLLLELEGLVEALPGGRYCRLPARSR